MLESKYELMKVVAQIEKKSSKLHIQILPIYRIFI